MLFVEDIFSIINTYPAEIRNEIFPHLFELARKMIFKLIDFNRHTDKNKQTFNISGINIISMLVHARLRSNKMIFEEKWHEGK